MIDSYCDEAQGYFYAKPMPANSVERLFQLDKLDGEFDIEQNDQLNNVY